MFVSDVEKNAVLLETTDRDSPYDAMEALLVLSSDALGKKWAKATSNAHCKVLDLDQGWASERAD